MKPIRLILVAIRNPGPQRHRLVAQAARLARALGARLELFHAIDEPVHVDTYGTADEWFESRERDVHTRYTKELERIAVRLRRCGLQVGTAAQRDFPAAEAIVRRAQRIGADLIVVERCGGQGLARWMLHPTAREALRLSPVPLLLVSPNTPPYRYPVMVAAVDPSRAHAKPATLDRDILRASRRINHALGGTLHVVHARPPRVPFVPVEVANDAAGIAADLDAVDAAEAELNVKGLLMTAGSPDAHLHVLCASVKDAIRSVALSTHCSVITVGAVPRTGVERLLVGNTAERILDADLRCDLLVIKPHGFTSRTGQEPRGTRFASPALFP